MTLGGHWPLSVRGGKVAGGFAVLKRQPPWWRRRPRLQPQPSASCSMPSQAQADQSSSTVGILFRKLAQLSRDPKTCFSGIVSSSVDVWTQVAEFAPSRKDTTSLLEVCGPIKPCYEGFPLHAFMLAIAVLAWGSALKIPNSLMPGEGWSCTSKHL
jgi:hypothetical protein